MEELQCFLLYQMSQASYLYKSEDVYNSFQALMLKTLYIAPGTAPPEGGALFIISACNALTSALQ